MRVKNYLQMIVVVLSLAFSPAFAAELTSAFQVLVEKQTTNVRFSVQDESTVALRLEILSLDGRRIFQSDWQTNKTVVWPLASFTERIVANGVYLYAVSMRDRHGTVHKQLGKFALVSGQESQLSEPSVGRLAGVEPSAAQFPLTAGTSWTQRLGTDRSDTFRILRRPPRAPGGPPTSFEQLLQLGADGKLRIKELCLGTIFAPITTLNPDNLTDGGDCRSSWSGVSGGGGSTSNGWMDDGAIVRLANATDKVGIGTTSPSNKLDVRGSLTLDPGGSPGLYTSSSSGEQNRYLLLLNSPSSPSASGLKAGGVLVADSFDYANPGKNDLIVKGNVGIGTTSPSEKLVVQTESDNYGIVHTTGVVTVGTWVSDGSGSALPGGWFGTKSNHPLHFFTNNSSPAMTIDTKGNVGIGTTSPCASVKLHVFEGSSLSTGCPGTAILGESYTEVGVFGSSKSGNGVLGDSNSGIGVIGLSTSGIGVEGFSTSSIGVVGSSTSGAYIFEGIDNGANRVRFVVERATGNVKATGAFTGGGVDYADMLPVTGKSSDYEPGDVLVIGPDGKLLKSSEPYSTALAGVYSSKPAFVGDPRGLSEDNHATTQDLVPVALVGLVPVKVSAQNGAIHPGDLLTTSSLPGYAMKATDPKIGTILGKAMQSLETGTGVINVLVTLR